MSKKIILISGKTWSLRYLKDSFSESMLKKTTLITDKVSNELKLFLKNKKIDLIKTNRLTPSKLKRTSPNNTGSKWTPYSL